MIDIQLPLHLQTSRENTETKLSTRTNVVTTHSGELKWFKVAAEKQAHFDYLKTCYASAETYHMSYRRFSEVCQKKLVTLYLTVILQTFTEYHLMRSSTSSSLSSSYNMELLNCSNTRRLCLRRFYAAANHNCGDRQRTLKNKQNIEIYRSQLTSVTWLKRTSVS